MTGSKCLFILSLVLLVACSKKSTDQTVDSSSVTTSATGNSTAPASSVATTDTNMQAGTSSDTAKHTTQTQPFDSAKVSIASLPSTVDPYVKKHYPGYRVASAAFDPLCGGGPAIDVSIKAAGKPTYSVIFKPDGTFVQQEQDVPMSTAPAKVVEAVKQHYGDYKAGNQIERLTLADGSLEYLVDLAKGKIKKEVIFSKDGATVCENNE